MKKEILKHIEDSINIKQLIINDLKIISQIEELTSLCLSSLRAGGKIILAGNGGSFADAQHLSAEFTSRFMFDRSPLPSFALGTNSSSITAIANDYGYDQTFARELEAIAKKSDIFIPISTSGNSPNILAAVKIANKQNIATIALTGESGGKLKDLCECICVPSSNTARIQESHIMIGHIICGIVEAEFFKED